MQKFILFERTIFLCRVSSDPGVFESMLYVNCVLVLLPTEEGLLINRFRGRSAIEISYGTNLGLFITSSSTNYLCAIPLTVFGRGSVKRFRVSAVIRYHRF